MQKLSIIIPVFNEAENISHIQERLKTYPPTIEVHFCDGGSTDETLERLRQFEGELNYEIHSQKISSPSVQKTVNLAIPYIKTKYFMIHPVDAVAKDVIDYFLKLPDENFGHLIPYKKYDSAHKILEIQERVLNSLRVKILKSFVWTNCPIISLENYHKIENEPEGFLEDVVLSDNLKTMSPNPKIIKKSVIISSRRYHKDGVLNRFLGNLYIMVLFRLKLRSISDLKQMYYKN